MCCKYTNIISTIKTKSKFNSVKYYVISIKFSIIFIMLLTKQRRCTQFSWVCLSNWILLICVVACCLTSQNFISDTLYNTLQH